MCSQVEIEVPGTCQYVVHTKECTLSEVIDNDADGSPVFRPAAGADTFKAEMEKYVSSLNKWVCVFLWCRFVA